MGEFIGFRKFSWRVIQGNLHGVIGAEAIGSSGHHSDFVVQTFDGSIGNLSLGLEPIEDQLFMCGDREPADLDVAWILTDFVPLSKLMAERITRLRNWARGRARLATSTQEVGGGP